MTVTFFRSACTVSLALFCVPMAVAQGIPESDTGAAPIIERVNAFYRQLSSASASGSIHSVLAKDGTTHFDKTILFKAEVERPNRVSVRVFEGFGIFPTNEFISNGTDLYEMAIKRRMWMSSKPTDSINGLFERAAHRGAPNAPLELVLALFSNEPVKNAVRLDIEPGLIRLGTPRDINGIRCDELIVNEGGARLYVQSKGKPWVWRYDNSPTLALPRYIPNNPGATYTGPRMEITFDTWTTDPIDGATWTTSRSGGYRQMETMHESDEGGPEAGFSSMRIQSGEPPTGLLRLTSPEERFNQERLVLGLPVGSAVPGINMQDPETGALQTIDAIRAGKPAVVVFWIDGEKFSRASIAPMLGRLAESEPEVAVIPVGSDQVATTVLAAIHDDARLAGTFSDPGGVAADQFKTKGVPATFVIDHEGKINAVFIGRARRLYESVRESLVEVKEKAAQAAANASPAWTIDAVHSCALFRIRHLGAGYFWGRFNTLNGTVEFDSNEPKSFAIDVSIDVASIDSGTDGLDKHLQSPDFFDAKEFPTMQFVSKTATLVPTTRRSDDPVFAWDVTGDLTVHGITKEVTSRVSYYGATDMGRGERAGFEATFTMTRSAFEMNYGIENKALGNLVKVTVAIEASAK